MRLTDTRDYPAREIRGHGAHTRPAITAPAFTNAARVDTPDLPTADIDQSRGRCT